MNPFFSIVIPVRNEYKRLQYCLPSLLKQTFPYFEIIVVDDLDTNSYTKEYVLSFQDRRVRYFVWSRDPKQPILRQVAAKRNVGGQKSLGQYLYFIDADMEFPLHTLYSISKEIKCLKADIVFVKERTPGNQWIARLKDLEKQIIQNDVSLSFARIYSNKIFNRLGGFNSSMTAAEEDFSDRAIQSGAKYIISNSFINHYEISNSLISHCIKKIRYGLDMDSYFYIHKLAFNQSANPRITTARLIYFKSSLVWKKPLFGLLLIAFKLLEFSCIFLGIIISRLTISFQFNTFQNFFQNKRN